MTLYRRYQELDNTLSKLYNDRFSELNTKPKIVCVYAQPEERGINILQHYKSKQYLDDIILRQKLPFEGEKGGITYPESVNIQVGLDYIKNKYTYNYIIFQTADLCPEPRTYEIINNFMMLGVNLVAFQFDFF